MNKLSLLLANLLFAFSASAQVITPPTDAAINLKENIGQTAVEPSTGTLTYSFPLFSLGSEYMQLPISLSYAATGIKVDQNSGIYGLGWGLTTGPTITRVIRGGINDEHTSNGRLYINFVDSSSPGYEVFRSFINSGLWDGESDLFVLNLASSTVKFILTKDTNGEIKPLLLERSNIKIELIDEDGGEFVFKVTDEQGLKYAFKDKEYAYDLKYAKSSANSIVTPKYISSWHITTIEDINGGIVSFSYDQNENVEINHRHYQDFYLYGNDMIEPDVTNQTYQDNINNAINDLEAMNISSLTQRANILYEQYLFLGKIINGSLTDPEEIPGNMFTNGFPNKIESYINEYNNLANAITTLSAANQTIANNYLYTIHQNRTYMYDYPYSRKSQIRNNYYSLTGKPLLLRSIGYKDNTLVFDYSYQADGFVSEGRNILKTIYNVNANTGVNRKSSFKYEQTSDGKRFLLKNVAVIDITNNDTINVGFEYYKENNVSGQDAWGGYSSKQRSDTLIQYYASEYLRHFNPEIYGEMYNLTNDDKYLTGINNAYIPDSAARHLSLKSVMLPLGGKYLFEYECNDIFGWKEGDSFNPMYPPNISVGGIRIKSIKNLLKDNTVADRTNYIYTFPTIFQGIHNTMKSTGRIPSKYMGGWADMIAYSDKPFKDFVITENIKEALGAFNTGGNNGVFYSYVEEEKTGKGRTGYRYQAFHDGHDALGNVLYPYWLENILIAKTYYDENNRLVKLDNHKYRMDQTSLDMLDENTGNILLDGSRPFNKSLKQLKQYKYLNFAQPGTFPDENQVVSQYKGSQTFYNPYQDNYLPNFDVRKNTVIPDLHYDIFLGGKPLLTAHDEYLFSNPVSFDSVHTLSSTVEKPDFFKWVISSGTVNQGLRSGFTFYYDNPLHTNISRQVELMSNQKTKVTKTKYLLDYNLPLDISLTFGKRRNILNTPVEIQEWITNSTTNTAELTTAIFNKYVVYTTNTTDSTLLPAQTSIFDKSMLRSISMDSMRYYLGTIPPYNTLSEFYSSYVPDAMLTWKKQIDGYKQSAIVKRNGIVNRTAYSDRKSISSISYSEINENEVTFQDFNNIIAPGNGIDANTTIRYFISPNDNQFSQASSGTIWGRLDHRRIFRNVLDLFEQFKKDEPALYGNLSADPSFSDIDTLLRQIFTGQPLDSIEPVVQRHTEFIANEGPFLNLKSENKLLDFNALINYLLLLTGEYFPGAWGASQNVSRYNVLLDRRYVSREYQYYSIHSVNRQFKVQSESSKRKYLVIATGSGNNITINYTIVHSNGSTSSSQNLVLNRYSDGSSLYFAILDLTSRNDILPTDEIKIIASASEADKISMIAAVPSSVNFTITQMLDDKRANIVIDQNLQVRKYEYDGYGRLSCVKDERNNVLKAFSYAFQSGL